MTNRPTILPGPWGITWFGLGVTHDSASGSRMIQPRIIVPQARKPSTSPGRMIQSRFTIRRNRVVRYNFDSANPYMTGPLFPSAESAGPCATRNFVIRAPMSYRFQSLTYLARGGAGGDVAAVARENDGGR
jgi:hypothetical protein